MDAYILSVCGAVLLSSLIVILLPEGKIGKFINGILKLFCLLVILVPLFAFLKDGTFSEWGEETNAEVSLDEEFIDKFCSARAEEEEDSIEKIVQKELSVTVSAKISWVFVDYSYEVSNAKIKIENFGMYGDDEHILVITEIKDRVTTLLNIPSEAVEVYE